jgi:hypothetical protein
MSRHLSIQLQIVPPLASTAIYHPSNSQQADRRLQAAVEQASALSPD